MECGRGGSKVIRVIGDHATIVVRAEHLGRQEVVRGEGALAGPRRSNQGDETELGDPQEALTDRRGLCTGSMLRCLGHSWADFQTPWTPPKLAKWRACRRLVTDPVLLA